MKRLNGMGPMANSAFQAHQAKIVNNTERGAYNSVLEQQRTGQISGKALITEGYLRSESNIVGSANEINFKMLTNEGVVLPTERRLNISDAFVATMIAVAYLIRSTDDPLVELYAEPLRTYPDPAIVAAAADLRTTSGLLYNASLQIRVNQTVFFDRYDVLRFRRAGTAQIDVNTVPPAIGEYNQFVTDSFDANQPFSPIVPFITLGGQDDIQVSIKLPVSTVFTTEDGAIQLVPVFMCRGLLIQNAYA